MTNMLEDYRDEFEAVYDFVIETIRAPANFSCFNWLITTDDRMRFASSSAVAGGPVNLSVVADAGTVSSLVRRQLGILLTFPSILAVADSSEAGAVDFREVVQKFRGASNVRLIEVSAGGRRLTEVRDWSLNMIFMGVDGQIPYSDTTDLIARSKPLVGARRFSRSGTSDVSST